MGDKWLLPKRWPYRTRSVVECQLLSSSNQNQSLIISEHRWFWYCYGWAFTKIPSYWYLKAKYLMVCLSLGWKLLSFQKESFQLKLFSLFSSSNSDIVFRSTFYKSHNNSLSYRSLSSLLRYQVCNIKFFNSQSCQSFQKAVIDISKTHALY